MPEEPKDASSEHTEPTVPQSVSTSTNKPIDRWLGLTGIGVGFLFFLLTKTPTVVVICTAVMFGMLVHPILNFWWIEEGRLRKGIAVSLWAAICLVIGFAAWPTPQPKFPTSEEIADAVARKLPRNPPRPDVMPAPGTHPPRSSKRPSKDDLQVIGLDTNQSITISNLSDSPVFVLDLLVTVGRPYKTTTFGLGFNVPGKSSYTHRMKGSGPLLRSMNRVAKNLEDNLEQAKSRYGANCIDLVAYSDSDNRFIQMREAYASANSSLAAFAEKGILHYRFSGDTETSAKGLDVVVLPMLADGCARVDNK